MRKLIPALLGALFVAAVVLVGCSGNRYPPPVSYDDDWYVDQVCVDYSYVRRPDAYCASGLPGYHWVYDEYHPWDRPVIVAVGRPVNRASYVDNRPTNVNITNIYIGDSAPPARPSPSARATPSKAASLSSSVQRGGLGVQPTSKRKAG